MKLVHAERTGEAFDSQLVRGILPPLERVHCILFQVIGVRESYVNLSSNTEDKLQVQYCTMYAIGPCTSLSLSR